MSTLFALKQSLYDDWHSSKDTEDIWGKKPIDWNWLDWKYAGSALKCKCATWLTHLAWAPQDANVNILGWKGRQAHEISCFLSIDSKRYETGLSMIPPA